jgi:hypothetical protein
MKEYTHYKMSERALELGESLDKGPDLRKINIRFSTWNVICERNIQI